MNDDKNKKSKLDVKKIKECSENQEDTTQYGEFMSSYFGWISPEEQKERAKELSNKTKK